MPDSSLFVEPGDAVLPQDILAARCSAPEGWALPDSAANRALEQQLAAQHPPHTLMGRAGGWVARWALALQPHARHILVLAGPGNNGGDGFEAARRLHRAGRQVCCRVVLPEGRTLQGHPWPTDAADALQRALAEGVDIALLDGDALDQPSTPGHPPPEVLIDALLGRGLRRPPDAPMARAIAWINELGRAGTCVLSVDLPSGLPADTGAPLGDAKPVNARATLALLSLPAGLFTAGGRDAAGSVWFHDLGAASEACGTPHAATAWLASLAALQGPGLVRRHAHHKGSFGDLLVVGGAPGMIGAARLAARAALAGGAGRVYLAGLDPAAGVDVLRPELMTADPHGLSHCPGRWSNSTVVAGCGGGTAIGDCLSALLELAPRLVLDADALNEIAASDALRDALAERSTTGVSTVLTPHPLEAARLLGCTATDVQADRLGAAQALSRQTGAVVVLKGSGTVIARPDSMRRPQMGWTDLPAAARAASVWLLPVGNAALGTPGSGDVLAGLIGSWWGRLATAASAGQTNTPSDPALTAAHAAALAVSLHGLVAERSRPMGGVLPAADLIEALTGLQPDDLLAPG